MKTLFLALIYIIFLQEVFTQSEPEVVTNEISLFNWNTNTSTIYARIYPVSMAFNHWHNYDMKSVVQGQHFTYINGRNQQDQYITLPPDGNPHGWGHEHEGNTGQYGNIGYGIYKIEFSYSNTFSTIFDSILVEYDWMNSQIPPFEPMKDVSIHYYENVNEQTHYFTYDWAGQCTTEVVPSNRFLRHYHRCDIQGEHRPKNNGPFLYDDSHNNNYAILPLDMQSDCYPENMMQNIPYNRSGLLTMDLIVKKDVNSRHIRLDETVTVPTGITIGNGSKLTLDNNVDYLIGYNTYFEDEDGEDYYHIFTILQNGILWLNPGSLLTIDNTNHFVLENGSKVHFNGGKIELKRGSKYCNKGGIFENFGFNCLIVRKGVEYCFPNPPVQTVCYVKDSAKIYLDTGAVFEIPDSTTYIFEGNESALICSDSNSIKFGKQSKLVFTDGARIFANNCKFTSLDSTQVWNGIYLSDLSRDTLKNCTFQNAVNGINIENKVTSGINDPEPATLIENCTFKNSTSTTLLNCVYVNNSQNVLIKDCDMVKTSSGGFTAGYIVEYCPVNGVIIVDNTVSYAETGITVIQSSPYIARNTLNGITNTGIGISLDNSNGTIEYNKVYNYDVSASCYYSSPYMLKNTFSDAQSKNMELTSYSVPVMRPVVSGSSLLWLGGNNFISGVPSEAGITFEEYAYPLIDSGYNVTNVNGSMYMSGVTASMINFTMNNWYDDPPEQSLFDISGSSFEYEPAFDGTSLPSTDYSNLNSLGFGLYDTVFVKDLGDNPNAESLFMQAYSNEMSNNYTTAISKYKDVISEYKTSSYASVSLSRIFNCLEKANSSTSAYQTIQSYYNSTKNDTNYPTGVREISDDYRIKSKVKQGMIEDAISDYNSIYQNNPNTSKGLHALLNKLCLMNMNEGGDNTQGSAGSNGHKANLLALILGKDIKNNQTRNNNTLPFAYKLHQNYPNPFNPVTMIRYDIPTSNMVNVKVYDLLGREVFSSTEYKTAGSYEVRFDGTNLASGLYFYSIDAGKFRDVKKMVLVK